MKFIWYIIAVVVTFAAIIAYLTIESHPPVKNIALSINRKHITQEEFDARLAAVHALDRQDFINSLIVKELMIQDAQKEGIDKDEAFRRSIQEYYEQSLVKQVMDKKNKSLKVAISDSEIDHFVSFQNSTIKLTAFSADDEKAAKSRQFKGQETRTIRVNDLSGDIGDRLESIKVGEFTAPLCSDYGCDVYRLDAVDPGPTVVLAKEKREKVRETLVERKRQWAMDSWIADLRAKSDIRILTK